MKKRVIMFFAVILILSLSSAATTGALPIPSERNDTVRHRDPAVPSAAAKNYYIGGFTYDNFTETPGAKDASSSYTAMQNNLLFEQLHELMTITHTGYTSYAGYKAGSLAYYWPYTDTQAGADSYLMFYSDVPGNAEGIKLNREHIWPKSRASYNQKFGGADLHHLRPSVDSLNNAKSDHLFGYVNGTYSSGCTEGSVLGNVCYWVNKRDDLFECKDDVKGDAARILLYVYCRWEQPNLYSDVDPSLLPPFDSDDNANSGKRAIESLDTLLQWCENDPVDAWEIKQNDIIQQIQGNRNVFIDYPELAWPLFGRDIPANMATPTHAGCVHRYTEVERHEALCLRDGSFLLRCEACGSTQERRLAATGHQDADKDGICDRCGRAPGSVILGDADGDGAVTPPDVTLIQRFFAEMTDETEIHQDAAAVTGKDFDVTDATLIGRYLAGIDTPYPIGSVIG